MPQLLRDNLNLYYRDEGQGAPCLLLHGHTLDHRIWDQVSAHLVAAGRRVIRADLRGHGTSSRAESGYHWSHHAADMAAVLEHAGVEAATVVGFSLGGGIALELVLSRPELASELVLVAPVMPDRPFEEAFLENLKAVARSVRSEGVAAAMRGPWMASPLFAHSLQKPGVKPMLEKILADFSGADYLAKSRDSSPHEWRVPDRLADIRIPTRVMVGGAEMEGFRAYADEAAEGIPGATLLVVADAGHLLPLEEPRQVAEIILG